MVILCVDDDRTALTVRCLLLSIAGYTFLEATSAKAALGLFNCNRVNLVITDNLLPDGTGAAMTLAMKQLKPDVPIVLLTASVALPHGYDHADLLLTKDIEPQQFPVRIANVIGARHGAVMPFLQPLRALWLALAVFGNGETSTVAVTTRGYHYSN